jgi:hypothetical protein
MCTPHMILELYKGFFMEEITPNLLDFKGRFKKKKITRFLWEVSTVGSQEYKKVYLFIYLFFWVIFLSSM